MGIIKIYRDKKWTLQFLDALYNSIDKQLTFLQLTLISNYVSNKLGIQSTNYTGLLQNCRTDPTKSQPPELNLTAEMELGTAKSSSPQIL
jgi:hypothetical protein